MKKKKGTQEKTVDAQRGARVHVELARANKPRNSISLIFRSCWTGPASPAAAMVSCGRGQVLLFVLYKLLVLCGRHLPTASG